MSGHITSTLKGPMMYDTENDAGDDRVFNVLQIVALNVATTTGAVVAYSAAGAPFVASLMGGFATGPVVTMAIALTAVWVKDMAFSSKDMSTRTHARRETAKGPPLVQGTFSTIEDLWNSDRMLELENARDQQVDSTGRRPRRNAPEELVAMWELDAAKDAQAVKGSSKRVEGSDRRSNVDDEPFFGKERRVGTRR